MGIFKDCFGDVRRFQNEFFECSERPIMIFFCEVKYANRGIISGSIRIVSKFSDPPCFWDGFLLESGSGKVNVEDVVDS